MKPISSPWWKQAAWLLAVLAPICMSCSGQVASSTNIAIANSVIRSNVKRFGINLGTPAYSGSGQMMQNLVFENPGFEGIIYQSMIRCAGGTANTCVDDDPTSVWPAGFWTGAAYEFVWGAANGRTGTVVSSTAAINGNTGAAFQFNSGGAAVAAGDYMIVRKSAAGGADSGWWMQTGGGGGYSTELNDLPPGTPGRQSLRLSAGDGQSVAAVSYLDSMGGRNFRLLNGSYTLTFSAKVSSGASSLNVQLCRIGLPCALNQNLTLTSSWDTYTVNFSANETASTPVSTVQFIFGYTGSGSVLLDDVSVVKTDGDSTNGTAFQDPVVAALRAYRPGILRYWAGQLGETIDNLTQSIAGRQRTQFSPYSTQQGAVQLGLHEFLELSANVNAEPWIVVPITVSPAEASWLIDYLAGAAGTAGGARRAARGQAAPWTSVFPKIHLEFGNEAWNGVFEGGIMAYSQPYGNRAQQIFAAMRSNGNFAASQFDLVIGGQAANPALNQAIQQACNNNDSFTTAPYQQYQVDSYSTLEQLWGPAFAEGEVDITSGNSFQNVRQSAAASGGRTVNQSVYEVNFHTTAGAIDQATLDQFAPALGGGIAVADHMLQLLRALGMRDQVLFALPQYNYQRPDGKMVKLWGAVVDMGVTDLRRPQFLALQMVNAVMQGNMVPTTHTGANPTWNQPLLNGVQLAAAHYLHSYAFSNNGVMSLVLVNLSRTDSLPVTFSGSGPAGTVSMTQLTSHSPSDTNESSSVVSPATSTLNGFNPSSMFNLPPSSLTTLVWTAVPGSLRK